MLQTKKVGDWLVNIVEHLADEESNISPKMDINLKGDDLSSGQEHNLLLI